MDGRQEAPGEVVLRPGVEDGRLVEHGARQPKQDQITRRSVLEREGGHHVLQREPDDDHAVNDALTDATIGKLHRRGRDEHGEQHAHGLGDGLVVIRFLGPERPVQVRDCRRTLV